MATVITSECINCGACEPECPNTAIYQGGEEWELNGTMQPPVAQDIFYIVPDKCSECVGFYDYEACAAVCPVDCCIPDPQNPETEAVLLSRAKMLHPDQTFPADFPSRFRKGGAPASAPEETTTAPTLTPPAPLSLRR
jgi:ferredoxin